MRNYLSVFFAMVLIISFGCDSDKSTEPDTEITFEDEIQPLFRSNCVGCHSSSNKSAGLNLDSWQGVIAGSENGEVVIPFDADNSLLLEMITKLAGGAHPSDQSSDTLSTAEIASVTQWISEGAKNDAGEVPFENVTNSLYAASQNAATVSIIDVDEMVITRNVLLTELGHAPDSKPHHIAVEPDGSAWYVSLIAENKVLKFDRSNQKIGEADISIPALLSAHPTNGKLYVSRFMQSAGDIPQLLGVIDRATMQTETDIPVARPIPHALASSSDGKYVYTCSLPQSQIIVIDAAINEVEEFIILGDSKGPVQLTISPDNNTLFVSAQISNEVFVIDVSDPNNRQIVQTIPVNRQPWHPVFTPDGSNVYVGNLGANTVTVINTNDFSTTVIGDGTGTDGISMPHGIAMAKDGSHVFVSCRNISGAYQPRHDFGDNANVGTVVAISTTTNQIVKVLEIEEFGSGMAL